jgi:hypothetical protein
MDCELSGDSTRTAVGSLAEDCGSDDSGGGDATRSGELLPPAAISILSFASRSRAYCCSACPCIISVSAAGSLAGWMAGDSSLERKAPTAAAAAEPGPAMLVIAPFAFIFPCGSGDGTRELWMDGWRDGSVTTTMKFVIMGLVCEAEWRREDDRGELLPDCAALVPSECALLTPECECA